MSFVCTKVGNCHQKLPGAVPVLMLLMQGQAYQRRGTGRDEDVLLLNYESQL